MSCRPSFGHGSFLVLLAPQFPLLDPRQPHSVVVMDELDILMSKINVVYNFFTWPDLPSSQLIVVAIANTMDLPERLAVNKISSRIGRGGRVAHPMQVVSAG